MKNTTYIISIGGSLIAPQEGVDWHFLQEFRALILKKIKQGHKFFLIAGGGKTARNYVAAAERVVKIASDDLDWLGIHATRLNAHLLRTIFRDQANPEIITNPTFRLFSDKQIMVAAGWKPGWSTDYVAARLAEEYGAKTIINLSNIDYVYDKDPNKHRDAKIKTKMNWPEFRKLVGNKWSPALNAPFDPVAAKKSQELKLEVVIMNGKNIKNLQNYLENKKFIGTVIK
ncbi:MAG: UMP kinase [Patescibacteria group bacterium]|nr:UMP kinase [Patescibacteria group bacterium]